MVPESAHMTSAFVHGIGSDLLLNRIMRADAGVDPGGVESRIPDVCNTRTTQVVEESNKKNREETNGRTWPKYIEVSRFKRSVSLP